MKYFSYLCKWIFIYVHIMDVRHIVYYCLDAIKAFSDDSSINEEHVLYLVGKYRALLLKKYGEGKKGLSESNYQTICLDIEKYSRSICSTGNIMRSTQEIPVMLDIVTPTILLYNGMESENIIFTSFKRLKAVGAGKYSKNFIYCALGEDKHLYFKSNNFESSYLKKIKLKAIFEDYEKAYELNCNGTEKACDVLDTELPIEPALVPELIAYIVKEILGTAYRPKDNTNNASDDLSDLMYFIRQNMKKPLQKQLEGDE